jgi:uncharacterized protein
MMINPRWLVAIPIVLSATLISASADGSTIRDRAHMFSEEAVKKAQAELNRIERATHIPVVIETIDKVPGLDAGASAAERKEAINSLAVRKDNAIKDEGIYYLISKNDRLNSNILVRERFTALLSEAKRDRIGHAFLEGFKKKDFDGGLLSGVEAIERALEGASIGHKAAEAPGVLPVAARPRGGQSAMGTFLLIILGIFGVLLVLRLLGSLFGRSAGAGYPGQMGGMGMRPGMGPGYGGPGYGGGGGGFFSGMLGGLGGALAGNWLYDQFSGRHGGMNSADAMHSADYGAGADPGGDAIVGADDAPAGGNSWDDGGAADTGGGDWGGGGADQGGGGDWGGGGGDWGGGGGDWGGGGGGGDW